MSENDTPAMNVRVLHTALAVSLTGFALAGWHTGALIALALSDTDLLAVPMPVSLHAGAVLAWLAIAVMKVVAVHHVRFGPYHPWFAAIVLAHASVAGGFLASVRSGDDLRSTAVVSLSILLIPTILLPFARFCRDVAGDMSVRRVSADGLGDASHYLRYLPLSIYSDIVETAVWVLAAVASHTCVFLVRTIRWFTSRAVTRCRAPGCSRTLSDPPFRCPCGAGKELRSHACLAQPLYALCAKCRQAFPLWLDWGRMAEAAELRLNLPGCETCRISTRREERHLKLLIITEEIDSLLEVVRRLSDELRIGVADTIPKNKVGLPVAAYGWTTSTLFTVPVDKPIILSLSLRYRDDRPIWAGEFDMVVFCLPSGRADRRSAVEWQLRSNVLPLPNESWGEAVAEAPAPTLAQYLWRGQNEAGSERFLRTRPVRTYCWKGRSITVNGLEVRSLGRSSLGREIAGAVQ